MKEIKATLDELDTVVKYLTQTLSENAILFLRGDLASGKTTLTQAIAQAMDVVGEVTSPTFSLQQCYVTKEGKNLYHYDVYRLEHDAFMQLGLFEAFEEPGWHLVEWGSDTLKSFLEGVGYNVVTIDIQSNTNSRTYRIMT